ncbi:hypothetical protein ACIBOV_31885 [Micromonospora chersina]|uniref:hypothetical protein n=1 Tax=Micromonospora chersina TaxID=47854 RepID=UPI0037BB4123
MSTDPTYLHALAGECVDLVSQQYETSPGAPAVAALGVTGFPFGLAARVLDGEPYKSLASFVRALPATAERAATD